MLEEAYTAALSTRPPQRSHLQQRCQKLPAVWISNATHISLHQSQENIDLVAWLGKDFCLCRCKKRISLKLSLLIFRTPTNQIPHWLLGENPVPSLLALQVSIWQIKISCPCTLSMYHHLTYHYILFFFYFFPNIFNSHITCPDAFKEKPSFLFSVNLFSQVTRDRTGEKGSARGGLDWILQKNFFAERLVSFGTGCPRQCWNHHHWKCTKICGCGTWGHGWVVNMIHSWTQGSQRSFPT